jgi:hypothetical protein
VVVAGIDYGDAAGEVEVLLALDVGDPGALGRDDLDVRIPGDHRGVDLLMALDEAVAHKELPDGCRRERWARERTARYGAANNWPREVRGVTVMV